MSRDRQDDVYRPDPKGAEPSPVAGLSQAEFDAIADNIRWFSRLTLSQQLRAIARNQRRTRRLLRLAERAGE